METNLSLIDPVVTLQARRVLCIPSASVRVLAGEHSYPFGDAFLFYFQDGVMIAGGDNSRWHDSSPLLPHALWAKAAKVEESGADGVRFIEEFKYAGKSPESVSGVSGRVELVSLRKEFRWDSDRTLYEKSIAVLFGTFGAGVVTTLDSNEKWAALALISESIGSGDVRVTMN